ncbi:hypothetical protein HDU79_003161 [Rhizoclosmatium sp. JEL0117]|nr:hypothetical protein HDU79_003161 [Rhizoclosmatium sp. JEL0117]
MPLSPSQLRDIAVDFAVLNGLVLATEKSASLQRPISHAPFALNPSNIPKNCFEAAVKLQPLFNTLVHKVSEDAGFLKEVMDGLASVDDFTGKCYDIYTQTQKEGSTQPIILGHHRSDYLLHKNDSDSHVEIQQVELNTIASSFACLSSKTSDLHRFLRSRNGESTDQLPKNNSLTALVAGFVKAWELYGNKDAVIVMVTQPGERNSFDQRWIENTLWQEYGINMLRKSLTELADEGRLVGDKRKLVLNGNIEVAITYYRAGYTPLDYPTEKEWQARLLVERSHAIKSPNVAYHLVGSKKVQQILAQPNMLERFVSPANAVHLRTCFTGLFPLDQSPAGISAYEEALKNPSRYVVKPQREGGGNNIYTTDIPAFLSKLSATERNAYILMELIKPPPARNLLVRNGEILDAEVVSELGIYGIWISGEGSVVYKNEVAGHLLRTKVADSNEGGVAAGFAVLDSPLLV